jgi:hypothetical protein
MSVSGLDGCAVNDAEEHQDGKYSRESHLPARKALSRQFSSRLGIQRGNYSSPTGLRQVSEALTL